jgi:hypothetical protein
MMMREGPFHHVLRRIPGHRLAEADADGLQQAGTGHKLLREGKLAIAGRRGREYFFLKKKKKRKGKTIMGFIRLFGLQKRLPTPYALRAMDTKGYLALAEGGMQLPRANDEFRSSNDERISNVE